MSVGIPVVADDVPAIAQQPRGWKRARCLHGVPDAAGVFALAFAGTLVDGIVVKRPAFECPLPAAVFAFDQTKLSHRVGAPGSGQRRPYRGTDAVAVAL